MKRTIGGGFLVLAILLSLMLVIAGCASVPAPGSPLVPTPVKTITPAKVTPSITISTVKTLRTLAPATTPVPTPPPAVITTLPGSRYSVETCADAGGFVASPGERCPGSWLDTTVTFSCCSQQPAPDMQTNLTVVSARPLDLRVDLSDDPGSIVP
ncbi:hypothetical protein [Methanoregula sp.]|uniref:hypothetical protein n=1 Tax=Methanoregula sp. TaxID=2052170 RepID=UPI003562BE4B